MKRTRPVPNYFAETLREILEDGEVAEASVAEATGIPASELTELKMGKRRCTPDCDLRLSNFYGITPGFFMRLQTAYEMECVGR